MTTKSWKSQQNPEFTTRKLFAFILYAIVPLAFLCFYIYTSPNFSIYPTFSSTFSPKENEIVAELPSVEKEVENHEVLPAPASSPRTPTKDSDTKNGVLQEGNTIKTPSTCDYTDGGWVPDNTGPLYNGTSCGLITDTQNCINHGRPDTGFLYWKWKPKQCDVQRFNPRSFLQMIEGQHLAFVGDSLARNQLESLLCMLASVSPPNLVYRSDDEKFRRWHFPSHNANVSVYWSPFLVKGFQRENDGKLNHHKLYFDSIDEKWGSDLGSIDMVVLSIGHWYSHPALYFDGDSMIGCYAVEDVNCTNIEFFRMFGKAFNTTLRGIIERKGLKGDGIDVIVTTVSPNHFVGGWDKFGVCNKTKPFREEEKIVEGTDAELLKFQMDEVEKAKVLLNTHQNSFPNVRVAALDVTKLATLRPDGHPGPYMHLNPFPDGVKKPIQNDCVHWCMPGPVDTWNEIMLDIMKRWNTSLLT